MGMEYDMLPDVSPIVLDLETMGLPNAAEFLEPVQAARNLVDPLKIAEDIKKRTAERDEKLALDWNVGRIAALGFWTETRSQCSAFPTEETERNAIDAFWKAARGRTIVTFNGRGFDLPFLIQRSRYLGVKHPNLDLRPYGGGQGNVDLYLELTFGRKETPCMRQSLKAFCKRFGIPVHDDIDGKEIPALVAAGDWESVLLHMESDVQLTVALARRLGVVRPVPASESVAVA